MFTIALVGPDGAGKTTLARRLEDLLPFPVTYLYMSVNPASANRLLPTTWCMWVLRGRPEHMDDRGAEGGHGRVRSMATTALHLANQLAEEWYRAFLARRYVRRGTVVLFDRHYYFDYYATDVVGGERKSERLHGYMLSRLYPRPDLTIYLDAPPEVLHARKGEGTLTSLAQLRAEFLDAAATHRDVVVVDATKTADEVAAAAVDAITAFAVSHGVPPAPRREQSTTPA